MNDAQVLEKMLSHFTWNGWAKGKFLESDRHGPRMCLWQGIRRFSVNHEQQSRIIHSLAECAGFTPANELRQSIRLIMWNDRQPNKHSVLRLLRTALEAEQLRSASPEDFGLLREPWVASSRG